MATSMTGPMQQFPQSPAPYKEIPSTGEARYANPSWSSKAKDQQVGGSHYTNKALQPIEYILANNLPFCEGNIVKYITRWREKGGISDLKKVIHYAEFLIEQEEGTRNRKPLEGLEHKLP